MDSIERDMMTSSEHGVDHASQLCVAAQVGGKRKPLPHTDVDYQQRACVPVRVIYFTLGAAK